MDGLTDGHALVRGGPHQHQVASLQQPAGDQLFVAQGFAVAHLRRQVAVGGGGQPQVLRPQAAGDVVADPVPEQVGHRPFHREAPTPQQQLRRAGDLHRQQVHRRAADELGDEQVGGPLVELHRRPQLLQPALVEHGDAVAHGHRFHLVVGDVEGGGAEAPLQLHDLGAGAGAQLGVQVAEGFIHQEHRWLAGDGPAQGHPLLLTPGELLGPALQQGLQLQGGGHLVDARFDAALPLGIDPQGRWQAAAGPVQAVLPLLGQAAVVAAPQAEADVVGHAQVRVEGVALEHHRHIPLGGPQPAHGPLAHVDLAGGGGLQTRQQPQQGALAAA